MAPIRKEGRSGKSQLRQLQKMDKRVSKQRAELIRAKKRVEKDKAAAEAAAIILAERKMWNELHKKEIERSERFIALTLDILDAKDHGDLATAGVLEHSRSELLAKMEEEIQALMNTGGSRE
ncbi:hypothetical protein SLEP1_g34160 [Rubroshorea leprosula]|uniref:Uncharacterized protein n=1 Tax=Rubroshorea leprosula TaxID=152421 RepID=A0AAV5KIY6_9ROSI|nr:hypothetical protein SLEP1_g34160 [Rubroshorea leprosula]